MCKINGYSSNNIRTLQFINKYNVYFLKSNFLVLAPGQLNKILITEN